MQNFNSNNLSDNDNLDSPIPFDDGSDQTNVSHSPLNLGGGNASEPTKPTVKESPKPSAPSRPQTTAKVASQEASGSGRIEGVRTFFTKLHPGAINFLDEQITKWLKENPGVSIKRTNVITGQIQAKKTEPNIIITVWY